MGFGAVLWKEWLGFKSKILSITLSTLIGPLLYLVAFGWGLGEALSVEGLRYTVFVIPGIIAMNGMTTCFGTIANDLNIARIYQKTFEALMTAPIRMEVYTLARITANTLRGLYGATLILLVSWVFKALPHLDWYFLLILILNCLVFSSIGFIAGLLIDSHADMAKVSNFIITPMSFLCGTFFPLERFPAFLRLAFEALPLTQAVKGLRGAYHGPVSLIPALVLAAYLAILLPLGIRLCKKTE
jgi:ABC-type multidrug transport system permease subunit